jgi:hypothetical protein
MRFGRTLWTLGGVAIGALLTAIAVPIAIAQQERGDAFYACEKTGSLIPGSL